MRRAEGCEESGGVGKSGIITRWSETEATLCVYFHLLIMCLCLIRASSCVATELCQLGPCHLRGQALIVLDNFNVISRWELGAHLPS